MLSYFRNPDFQYLVSVYGTDGVLGFWASRKGRSLDFSTQAQSAQAGGWILKDCSEPLLWFALFEVEWGQEERRISDTIQLRNQSLSLGKVIPWAPQVQVHSVEE